MSLRGKIVLPLSGLIVVIILYYFFVPGGGEVGVDPRYPDDHYLNANNKFEKYPGDPVAGKTTEKDLIRDFGNPAFLWSFPEPFEYSLKGRAFMVDRYLRFQSIAFTKLREGKNQGYKTERYMVVNVFLYRGIVQGYTIKHTVRPEGRPYDWIAGKHDTGDIPIDGGLIPRGKEIFDRYLKPKRLVDMPFLRAARISKIRMQTVRHLYGTWEFSRFKLSENDRSAQAKEWMGQKVDFVLEGTEFYCADIPSCKGTYSTRSLCHDMDAYIDDRPASKMGFSEFGEESIKVLEVIEGKCIDLDPEHVFRKYYYIPSTDELAVKTPIATFFLKRLTPIMEEPNTQSFYSRFYDLFH